MAARRALRPLLDRVLVERIVAPTKSVGGVLLPESMTSSKVSETRSTTTTRSMNESSFAPLFVVSRSRSLVDAVTMDGIDRMD